MRNEYALAKVPLTVRWGEGIFGSYVALQNGADVPNIWIVGHLVSITYVANEKETRPRFRVQLELVRDSDRARANDILKMACPGPSPCMWPFYTCPQRT